MKNVFTILISLLVFKATAQDFKPAKVNLSAGYARPSGTGSAGGILLAVEPRYGFTDQFDVGLRFEGAFMARSLAITGQARQRSVNFAGSYILTSNYLLSVSEFRPYIGVGAGLYTTVGASVTMDTSTGTAKIDDASVKGGRKFGGMARIGFKRGHFTMGAEYNFIPATQISLTSVQVVRANNSYLGLKLGFDIGGGAYE